MSGIVYRIRRQPALLVGLVQAVLLVLVEFNVEVTEGQQAAIMSLIIAIGAVIIWNSVTPNVSVGAKQDDLEPGMVAGDASPLLNDTPVDVTAKDEYGHGTGNTLITVAAVLVIIVCLVWLLSRLL